MLQPLTTECIHTSFT